MRPVQRGVAVLLVFTFGLQTKVLTAGLSWSALQKVSGTAACR